MTFENIILNDRKLDIEKLQKLQQKPVPYSASGLLFWNDPHISRQLLAAHLDPNIDAASRRPETIDRTVAWLVQELALAPGTAVLDLGCGPGLYASRLAARGLRVTGVDYSENSIAYARQAALAQNLDIAYRCQDYLTLTDISSYEVALLIYGDFCPLAPHQRQTLLANIYRALKPEGRLVLDVSRHDPKNPDRSRTGWYAAAAGFWRPDPHLVLEQTISYPDQTLQLDQYTVIDAAGRLSVYRIWRQEYTRETITAELAANGFDVQTVWSDLTGTPDTNDGEWLGIVAQKH